MLLTLLSAAACRETDTVQTETVVLIDDTDALASSPDPMHITEGYGVSRDMWQGIRVTVAFLSDRDFTAVRTATLPRESRLLGSRPMRQAKVRRFAGDLEKAMESGPAASRPRSILYRTLAGHLNALSGSRAPTRHAIVYSDLMENSRVSFYDGKTLEVMATAPEEVQALLEKDVRLKGLSGVEVWLVFEPKSYEQNDTYLLVSGFYRTLLESKGATVHVSQSFR